MLPTIWKEDAELQAERVAAAKKSPMHLFLTEISSVTRSSESKSEDSWEVEKERKSDGERWGNVELPNRGMRRSQSLITELGSAGQSWGPEKCNNLTGPEEDNTVSKEAFQRDLFLTEIDTGRMDSDLEEGPESDPVKYLYPAGSRLRPYVCAPGLPSYNEAEEASSKGIRRSRSLLSELTTGKQESDLQQSEKEPQRTEMTREEFLKEIHSAETFLTEIISRQNVATTKKEADSSYSPTPLSPEYESICIDPNSTQTITFQSESSVRTKGKDDTQTEAIYAQVTKRAKKSEIKISKRPEIPILHIGSNIQSLQVDYQGSNADHCQTSECVFSEIMPKNGLLHNEEEAEQCSDGPDLPARGEQTDPVPHPPLESTERVDTVCELRENKPLTTYEVDSHKAALVGNGNLQSGSPKRGNQTCGKDNSTAFDPEKEKYCSDKASSLDFKHITTDDVLEGYIHLGFQNNDESFAKIKGENLLRHNDTGEESNCHIAQKVATPACTPTSPDWDPSSDVSIVTPTDSVLSPMTSNSADCLTPSDSWMSGGGGVGNDGLRALGNETPHRDSAYFSDSDWEGDGVNRRSSDGLIASRPSSGRGGERGTLMGIEEKTEEEGEMGEKSPLKNSIRMSANKGENGQMITIEMSQERSLYQNAADKDISHLDDDKDFLNNGLESGQRNDSGIFPNESKKSTALFDDLQAKDCIDLIDKLFSDLDDELLKGLPHSSGYPIDSHFTDGIVSQITECKHQDTAENDLNVEFKNNAETNILIKQKDCALRPKNDPPISAEMGIDLNSLECGNDTVKLYVIQATDAKFGGEILSVVEASDGGKSVYDKVSSLTCPSLGETGVDELGRHNETPDPDHNELGLRNLCFSDGSKDNKATADTEKQLAAGELNNTMKEKSALRGATSRKNSAIDTEFCEGLDVKTKELWIALEEDEECTRSAVVRGEFDYYRFSQSRDLHLWPDENDQWASPERRYQDTELRSEFFSGFSKAWEVGERLIVGQEFWETEGNDELAGSEPHPAVLEACEETWNNETQELGGNLIEKQNWDSKNGDYQKTAQVVNVQQEENIENLGEIGSLNEKLKREISDIEVENFEIPEKETLKQGDILSCSDTVRGGKGLPDSTETEENQNFNRWPLPAECVDKHTDCPVESNFSPRLENKNSHVSICITEPPIGNFSDLENVESGLESEVEIKPWLAKQCIEERLGILDKEEDCREEIHQAFPQVDNFSSVDFPSPPPSIDLDVQEDKLESLDESFPSPPPSVVEAEELISPINLEDFIASVETEPSISPTHKTDVSEPLATTQSIGISANLNLPSVHITIADASNLKPNEKNEGELTTVFQNTSSATPSSPQAPLNNLPELLISDWKDLDEEPLEDFEKLEQLCCISGDEEDTLGGLFLGNLKLLESLKKAPDMKGSSADDSNMDEMHGSSSTEGSGTDLKEDEISESSDKLAESATYVILDPQNKHPPPEVRNNGQRSPGQTTDIKDQGSLSKMTTKNGLMMQVSLGNIGVLFITFLNVFIGL